MPNPSFYPGRRLSISSNLCTIRYLGTVDGSKGDWLGVEWDEPDKGRGKHSGDHDGVRYFTCLNPHPKAASFIRPSRPIEQPLTFLQALRKKYAFDETADPAAPDTTIEISGKVVEEVGFDKVRKQLATLQDLRIILLDGLCIAGIQARPWPADLGAEQWRKELAEITATCPKVTELDLSRNLLECLVDVAGICKALPQLKSLKLNGTRLHDFGSAFLSKHDAENCFRGITELGLDETYLTWEQITQLTSLFPSLTTLSLTSNAISHIPTPLLSYRIQTLILTSNRLPHLTAISPLTQLPELSTLTLRSNQITTLSPPSTPPPMFQTLTNLDISLNLISTLSPISHLSTPFPALGTLRISQNPVLAPLPPSTAHALVAARLPLLNVLNFSRITPADRLNAELYYLSLISNELSAAQPADRARILSDHPRWVELCKLHGAPAVSTGVEENRVDNTSLAGRVVLFTFLWEGKEKQIRVPRTVSVYKLKGIVAGLFGLVPLRIRLMWETGEWDPVGREDEGANGKDEDGRWSVDGCSEDGEDEDMVVGAWGGGETEEVGYGQDDGKQGEGEMENQGEGAVKLRKGKWIKREVELVDGTKDVGFWIEGADARVRAEARDIGR